MFRCNKCWKKMGSNEVNEAYITSCSHMFCVECGEMQFTKQRVCPGCGKALSGSEIQKVDLNPSEEFKQMTLCGLDPETIMEMASRGMSFYAYQKQNEIAYLSFLNQKTQQKMQQLEKGFESRLAQAKHTISVLNSQMRTIREEMNTGKKNYEELQERYEEKSGQKRKLEELFDALKQKYDSIVKNKKPGSSFPFNSRATPALINIPQKFPSPSLPLGGIGGSSASRRLSMSSSSPSSSSLSSSSSFSSSSSSSFSSGNNPFKQMTSYDTSPSPSLRPLQQSSNSSSGWTKTKTNYNQNPLRAPPTPSFSAFLKPKGVLEETN